jgi:hypothetical protein
MGSNPDENPDNRGGGYTNSGSAENHHFWGPKMAIWRGKKCLFSAGHPEKLAQNCWRRLRIFLGFFVLSLGIFPCKGEKYGQIIRDISPKFPFFAFSPPFSIGGSKLQFQGGVPQ